MAALPATLDAFHLLGDPTRVRLLALLAERELSVAELTQITELGQSRVSTHLARLRDAGVLRDRRDGASVRYALREGGLPEEVARAWAVLARDLDDPLLEADRRRCEALLRARDRGAQWADAVAGEMERHYSPGRTWEALARGLLGLCELGDVLDAGSGDGAVARLLAGSARSVTCLDRNPRMAAAARARLRDAPNVRVLVGDVEAIPAPDASFDQVLLYNVLACVPQPGRAVAELARVLRPGGRLVIVTLDAHDHADVTAAYGHVHPGFKPGTLRRLLARTDLVVERCEVTSRERREPHFQIVTAVAHRPAERRSRR
ncbi:MAG TPA: metalloregulator ArsR/SmtB family transcription factor [Candidatus Limnocylindria bacterium]|nr:metalloregulator ArsR/SmtB family transcription factor [Candidatus Limnocylindria bacterium]